MLSEEETMTDNVTSMPGVSPTDPKIEPNKYDAENALMEDLKNLIEKYNGLISNVAMVGCIQITQDMLTINLMTQGIEDD